MILQCICLDGFLTPKVTSMQAGQYLAGANINVNLAGESNNRTIQTLKDVGIAFNSKIVAVCIPYCENL